MIPQDITEESYVILRPIVCRVDQIKGDLILLQAADLTEEPGELFWVPTDATLGHPGPAPEIDLPHGSIVLDTDGRAWQRDRKLWTGDAPSRSIYWEDLWSEHGPLKLVWRAV